MDQHLMRILNDSTDAKRLLCEQSKCEEREKKNITIPRWVLQKADDITNIESTRHFIFPKKIEEIKHTRLNLCCAVLCWAELNITRLTKETTIQIMKFFFSSFFFSQNHWINLESVWGKKSNICVFRMI